MKTNASYWNTFKSNAQFDIQFKDKLIKQTLKKLLILRDNLKDKSNPLLKYKKQQILTEFFGKSIELRSPLDNIDNFLSELELDSHEKKLKIMKHRVYKDKLKYNQINNIKMREFVSNEDRIYI